MSTNGLQTDESVALSDRLLYLVRVVPWWAVMLVFGILYLGYNMLNDPNKRDVLDFLADRPQVQTDDLFSVTYRVETDALLVRESFLITDFSGERPTILLDDVISREEGILPCPADAPEDCNDLRGTIISYRVYDIPDGVEPAGTFRVEGLVRGQLGDFSIVNLINGEQVTVSLAAIVSEREGIFPCDRVAEPTCTSATGQILTFDRPFIIQQGREVRHDVVIRHLEDGFEEAIRPVFVRETREGILECDEDDPQPCAEIPVFYVTILENVSGVEIQRTDVAVRIRTVERVAFEIPRDRVLGMEPGIVECDQAADPRCQDYPGTMVQLTAETLTGRLTNETDTHYYVLFEDTGSPIRYNRGDITDELRSPESCRALDQDPPCIITVTLRPRSVGGRVTDTETGIEIETVPEKIVTIRRDDIISTSRRIPEDCALNNLRGCNEGIWLTIIVTFSSYSIALVIGLILGLFRLPPDQGSTWYIKGIRGVLYHLSTLYVELIRGIPLLVLLFAFAFVITPELTRLEGVVGDIFRWFFGRLDDVEVQILGINGQLSEAVLGLAVGYGAYLAEVFRAGIQSVSKGQMEAARSLGMSYSQSMRHVVLPQAIRVVLPPLGNDFIAILKDTSLISALALPELFLRGRGYASASYRILQVYTAMALFYVVTTLLLSLLVRQIERWSRLP